MKLNLIVPATALVSSGKEISLEVVSASVGNFFSQSQLLALATIEIESLDANGALVRGARRQFFNIIKDTEVVEFFKPLLQAHGFSATTDDVVWGVVAVLFQMRAFTNAYLAACQLAPLNTVFH